MLCPNWPMGVFEMVWSRERNSSRMLGSLWLWKFYLDSSGTYQLESKHNTELRIRGLGIYMECNLSGEESMACG